MKTCVIQSKHLHSSKPTESDYLSAYLSSNKTKESAVVSVGSAEFNVFSRELRQLEAVVVDEQDLAGEDAEQDQRVDLKQCYYKLFKLQIASIHLFLYPEPPDAVADILEAARLPARHLNCAQVAHHTPVQCSSV